MKNLWSIADLIDLHFFSQLDEEVQRKAEESGKVVVLQHETAVPQVA